MGNQEIKQDTQDIYQKLQLIRRLGGSKLLMKHPQTQEQFIIIENTFPSQSQAVKYYQDLQKRIEPCHQYYLGPVKNFIQANNNFCSKQFKAIQIYPYENYTLKDEIENRGKQGRKFTEKQSWSVLCSCVLAMANFNRSEITHFQLNPSDIILNAEGQIKILSSQLSDFQIDYVFKQGFFYAPETLKALRLNNICSPNNKAGVFTLGMSILSALLLQDLSFLYSQDFNLDVPELNQKLNSIQNPQMRDILIKMFKIAPYERISFTELEEMLYTILENNQFETDEDEIQKLEQSIYRIGVDNSQFQEATNTLAPDQEDVPDCKFTLFETDYQKIDEQDKQTNGQKDIQKQTEKNFLTENTNTGNIKLDNSNKRVSSKSVLPETSQVSSRTSSYYVSEQYNRGKYEGYKQSGMRQGFGTFFYEEGGRYSGEWKLNKMGGRGALYYANGEIAYEGEWNNDKLHGYGVLYNQNPIYITSEIDWHHLDRVASAWVKYEGNFSEDKKCGQGTLCLSNGEYYRGQFKDDQPCGKGLFRRLNGQVIGGYWENGAFIRHQN